ncbi:MAG: pyridoxamine 5'-phosphate oxidase family protein [Selenomonadaceae bacterium]|nr:pyridoxamine 5'-phosphate oxidase family protein [Selenomonadaceae bacterium]
MFREMRRSKQVLSRETAEKILREGDFGVLALSGDEGYAYAVPINYAVEGNKIYFHSAKTGHKLDAIRNNDKVSFCVVDRHEVVAEEFTTYFSSAIAFGRIRIVADDTDPDKLRGLELLADKYSSTASPERRAKELSRLSALVVPVMTIEHLTGKAARELVKRGDFK